MIMKVHGENNEVTGEALWGIVAASGLATQGAIGPEGPQDRKAIPETLDLQARKVTRVILEIQVQLEHQERQEQPDHRDLPVKVEAYPGLTEAGL